MNGRRGWRPALGGEPTNDTLVFAVLEDVVPADGEGHCPICDGADP